MSTKRLFAITGASTAVLLAMILILHHPGNDLSAQLNTPDTSISPTTSRETLEVPASSGPKVRPLSSEPFQAQAASVSKQPVQTQQIIPVKRRNTDNLDRDILLPGSYGYEFYGKKTDVSGQEDTVCSANVYDCNDFSSQVAAQKTFVYCLNMTGKDVHVLDEDRNGVACDNSEK